MKTFKTYLIVGFTALIAASCGSVKDTSTTNRGMSNTQVIEKTKSVEPTSKNSRQSMEVKSSESPMVYKSDDYKFGKLQPMYSEIDMDDSQIGRFENEWKKSVDSWKKNNPNKTMNTYEIVENQDRILMDILDDSQFEKYQQWVINNVGKE